jgi:TetR/AcrR family transcriptional repressor of nem operon
MACCHQVRIPRSPTSPSQKSKSFLLTGSGFRVTYRLVCMSNQTDTKQLPETKRKLVDAGVGLMRQRGFNATTVDDICAEAGVTKGGFFHYFKSKDDLATAAVARFYDIKAQQFADAPFRRLANPLERVFGRLDFAKESAGGTKGLTKGCLLGVFAQELSFTNAQLRTLCQDRFAQIAKDFEIDLAEAKALYASRAAFEPKTVAMLYVSIVQGSLMLAKASESNRVLMENIEQFRAYLRILFSQGRGSTNKQAAKLGAESRN